MLKRAGLFERSHSKSEQFRAYNDYKNLYLKSLMYENNKLGLKALRGIVRTGRKLHVDVAIYSRKLSKLSHSKKRTKIKIRASIKLESIRWRAGNLELTFNKIIKNNQINYYNKYDYKRKMYQYIFNIRAAMLKRSQTLKKEGVSNIRITQSTPNMLRLVIENSSPISVHFSRKSRKIIVRIRTSKIVHKSVMYGFKNKNKIIVIDPGHGGKDTGAIGYRGYREKNAVLAIGKDLRNILKARGYTVYMTRDADYFVTLRNRTKFANRKHADLFISIHANAVPKSDGNRIHGLETYYLSKSRSNRAKKVAAIENRVDLSDMNYYGKASFLNTLNSHNIIASNKMAIDIQRNTLVSLRKRYKYIKDAGVREAPFWVLVGAQMPAVLVETGFITNPMEAKRLMNSAYQKRLALGLANGIEHYFINLRKSR